MASGRSRSAGPARRSSSIARVIIQIASLRPRCPRTSDQGDLSCTRSLWLSPCPRSAPPRGMARRLGQHTALIASWACSYATKGRSAGSRPSCARIAGRRPGRRDLGDDQLAMSTAARAYNGLISSPPFSPALQPRFTFRGSDVVAIVERSCKAVGFPATIRVGQGSEFVSREF